VGQVARRNDLDACLLEPALLVALDDGDRLASRRKKNEHRFGPGILHALQERREIGVSERRADAIYDLTSGRLERLDERAFSVDPGAEIGHQRERPLDA